MRNVLPPEAQEIYRETYNTAWEQYADPDDHQKVDSHEETAYKVAWAAVKKKKYHKSEGGEWTRK